MQIVDKRYRHGCGKRNSPSRLYNVWKNMKVRCNNPHYKEYKYYGGRGITVCEEWNDFNEFQKWAYSNGYDEKAKRGECTLDRISTDKGYSPSNCRWVNMKVQCSNRRMWGAYFHSREMITWEFSGESHTVREWSEITGIDRNTLRTRWYKGWSVERILTTPKKAKSSDKEGAEE